MNQICVIIFIIIIMPEQLRNGQTYFQWSSDICGEQLAYATNVTPIQMSFCKFERNTITDARRTHNRYISNCSLFNSFIYKI